MRRRLFWLALTPTILAGFSKKGISVPITTPALFTTFLITNQLDAQRAVNGTMFRAVVDNREYWITARHVITGKYDGEDYGQLTTSTVKLLITTQQHETVLETFSIIDLGIKVDIVVLYSNSALTTLKSPALDLDSIGAVLGGECAFLGFPLGYGWFAKFGKGDNAFVPFTKRCSIAGMDDDTGLWILDGINNHGFSGGPVLLGEGTQQKIMAVVSGFLIEEAPVATRKLLPDGKSPAKTTTDAVGEARTNSGLMIAYDIKFAIEGIRLSPMGPLINP